MRGSYQHGHQYPSHDGAMPYYSSPSDRSLVQPWTRPPVQGLGNDELEISTKRDTLSGSHSFTPIMEGASIMQDDWGSTSSRSDGSDLERTAKLRLSTRPGFPSRRSFMSKHIHPVSFPHQIQSMDLMGKGYSMDLSSGSNSMDLTDVSDQFENDNLGWAYNNGTEGFKCGFCDRFLSQRSPWSSRRIITSGDLPVTAVLSCRHVFHADCLEKTTLKARKTDPLCPLCSNSEENSSEQPIVSGLRHGKQKSSLLSLGRNQIKKSLSLKGDARKELPGKLRKIGSNPLQLLRERFLDHALGSCSKATAGSSVNR